MAAMNLATQRRRGKLTKTPDMLTYKGHIYGNQHAGFKGRRPTPTSEGFFGFGSLGDSKLHYYGNDEGQADLPPEGFYGFNGTDFDYQVADLLPTAPADPNQAPQDMGFMDSVSDKIPMSRTAMAVYAAGILGTVWYLRR